MDAPTEEEQQALALLEALADADSGQQWRRVVAVWALLADLWPRSPEYRAMQRQIAERGRIRIRTQQYCLAVARLCCEDPAGEPILPLRLHWSTARWIAEHGGTHRDMVRADEEGWTLRQARAWSASRHRSAAVARRLWPHVTQSVPRELRHLDTTPTMQQSADIIRVVRDALLRFGAKKPPASPEGPTGGI